MTRDENFEISDFNLEIIEMNYWGNLTSLEYKTQHLILYVVDPYETMQILVWYVQTTKDYELKWLP